MTYITTHMERRSNRSAVWLPAAILLFALAVFGYLLVFAQFQDYDDEGYLLLTVQQFLKGLPVYDQIYTQYGPAYYLWQQILHGLLGIPVTHDATRVVTLVVWLVCAALVGTIVRLLTKRPLLGAVGTAAAFLHLTQLTFEPGHPQELCLLGVLGALTVTTWTIVVNKQIGMAASMAVWVLVAITALTKINVGAFLAAGLTLGLVSSLSRSLWRTVLEALTLIAVMSMVLVLMRGDLLRSDISAYVAVVWCGLLAAFISRSGDASESGVVAVRELVVGVSAFAIACGVIVAGIVSQGTSPRALFEGLFVAPLLLPKVFWRPIPVPVLLAIAAPATVFVAWWCRGVVARHRVIDLVALASGLSMFVLSIVKDYRVLFAVGPVLAWLVLSDRDAPAEQRVARRILTFAAILMGLQAYPLPDGTQIVLGTVLFVPLGIVMIAGAQRGLSAIDRPQPVTSRVWRRALLTALAVIGAANFGMQLQRLHARGIPIDLPGARSVRTTADKAATYWWLNANLRANCDAFISAPGLNSLHFWTQMPPVSTLNATLWPLLFDADQQRRILAAASPVERLCVAWSPRQMAVMMKTSDVASRPLVAWMQQEFEPRARVGDWELRMRRQTTPTALYVGRWSDRGAIVLDLPPSGGDTATRIAVIDADTERMLADSTRGEEIVVLDESGAPMNVTAGFDVSRRRRITLRPAATSSFSPKQAVVVRLWARNDHALAIVPVVKSGADDFSPVNGQ